MTAPLGCRIFGHNYDFLVDGTTMVWRCSRCGHVGGTREYGSPEEARGYARALNRGKPGPPRGFLAALGGTVLRKPPDDRSRR